MFFFRSKKLIVSQGESGCYQSISEAIHDASPDATILVRRGNYQESIIIDKPLTITGDGLGGDILIIGTDKNCITMQTHLSEVRNLTIRHPFSYGNAVYIPQGELMLEDCEIASEWVGIFIQGQKTNPTFRQCKINGGLCFGTETQGIFLTMCNNKKPGWICPENVSERLKKIFINMYENRGNNFANGRDVRNIFEKIVRRIKTRIVRENLSGQSMRTFSLNDIPPEL